MSDDKTTPARRRARRPRGASEPPGTVVEFTPAARRRKIAITGGAGILGTKLVKLLAARGDREIVVFDLANAHDPPPEVRHRFIDLNLPYADGTLLKLLQEERPDELVHLAAVRSPMRDSTYAHELNSIGTLHVLAAAGEAGIKRIIIGSTTLVYGARGDNPNYLTEDHVPRPDPQDRFVRDFVEAEQHVRQHVKSHPDCSISVLRFAPFLSPEVRDYRARMLEGPVLFTLLGYDPLLQVLDVDDGVAALLAAVDRPEARGVFNVTPDGVLPLSTFCLLYGTLPIPLPHPLAYTVHESLWLAGIGLMPGVHAHYLRYLCIAANDKAKKVLGWAPRLTTLEVVLATVKARRAKGRAIDFDELSKAALAAEYRFAQSVRPKAAAKPRAARPDLQVAS